MYGPRYVFPVIIFQALYGLDVLPRFLVYVHSCRIIRATVPVRVLSVGGEGARGQGNVPP